MGLTCSLLGHSFGEATVEREREERGSEVVTVVREVEECDRCGERTVVSENKEVTSVVEPEEVGLAGNQGAGSFNDDEFVPPDSVEEEDAEILDDADGGEREPGEWPEEPPGGDDFGSESAESEPGPADPTPADAGSADETEGTDDGDDGPDFDDETEIIEGGPAQTEATAASADSAGERDLETGADADDGEGVLVCPECGWEVSTDSSFLGGDACPECQRGYLQAR